MNKVGAHKQPYGNLTDCSARSTTLTVPESKNEGASEQDSKTSLDRYEDEWIAVTTETNYETLKKKSMDGELRASRFRSVHWRIFLKILGKDSKKWAAEITDHRLLYDRLLIKLNATPWSSTNNNCSSDNPLSQEHGSVWCRYFCDEELRAVIRQDVIRTFPGIDFFHSQKIQEFMVRILFLYARKNPSLCYRQGMHEVLAPILFVLHCDQEAFAHAKEMGCIDEDLMSIFDPQYIAADAFSIFSRVMANLESSYAVPKVNFTPSQSMSSEKERDNEVVWRLEYIKEKLLYGADSELAEHLDLLDIPLQLFGIRWLRLLFGREFPLQDLLVLWDVIFTSDDFFLVDYIVVAMLVAIRHLLLGRDYTTCLSCLMRYPIGVDVTFVLHQAHHLLDPHKYPKPPRPPTCSPAEDRAVSNRRLGSFSRVPSFRFRSSPSQPPHWITKSHLPLAQRGDGNSSAVEGFTLQDPERLRVEVEHLRAVMSLVRIKISQYHDVLQDVVHSSGSAEAFQALEGLHELCFLMKDPDPTQFAEVEPADEAGEVKSSLSPPPFESPEPEHTNKSKILLESKTHCPELETFKHTLGGEEPINGAPMADPLRQIEKTATGDDWRQFSKELNRLGVIQ